jgi:hypothetical protein
VKVLVAGSNHFERPEEYWEEASKACRQIGRALAEAGHELVVGSASSNTADKHVVSGFLEIDGHRSIRVIRSENDKSGFLEVPEGTEISYEYRGKTWPAARIHQAQACDVMLAVGGGSGTHLLAQTAIAVGRPVLPLHVFGGVSSQLWMELQSDLTAFVAPLSGNWSEESPRQVVHILEILRKNNPYRKAGKKGPLGLLLLVFALLTGWGTLLVWSPLGMLPTFFLLLVLSALLGVVLRAALCLLSDPLTVIHARRILTEAVVGVIVGFGLGLLFLAGGFALRENWSFADLGEVTNVVRPGVVMSLLGLAAGLKIEAAVERLEKELGVVLTK